MKHMFISIFVFFLCISSIQAGSSVETIAGGRLYDKWWVDAGLEKPTSTHPAYPAEGKKKGAATWRCKECHGWDYQGKGGAYKKGSHYTGINGIRHLAGGDTKAIVKTLKNKQHQFNSKLPPDALTALATFVSAGQMDMAKYIDSKSKNVNGNAGDGEGIFDDNCKQCHGSKGNDLNLSHKKGETETIGGIANKNPWETLHKIRFGHPGAVMGMDQMHESGMGMRSGRHMGMKMWEDMPPMYDELSEKEQVDLLGYLQTLPK